MADRRGHRSDTGHVDYLLGLEDVYLEADREEVDLEADPEGANFDGNSELEIDCVEYVQSSLLKILRYHGAFLQFCSKWIFFICSNRIYHIWD